MRVKTIQGEAWGIQGKEVIPLLKTVEIGASQRQTKPGYGFAYIRPVGFIVEEAGVRQRVALPSIGLPLGVLSLAAVVLPLATMVWRKAILRRAKEAIKAPNEEEGSD